MSNKTHTEQTRMKKMITWVIAMVLPFLVSSCLEEVSSLDNRPTPPSAVGELKVDSFNGSEVVFSWAPPTYPGAINGTPAILTGYVVKYKETADDLFIEIDEESEGVRLTAALTATSTDATVTGLDQDTSYTFLVVAVNSANEVGLEADAPRIEHNTPVSPGNLRNTQACARTNSVDLAWDPTSGATSYKLYRDDTEITNVSTNSYTDVGLTAGKEYTYTVRSCSAFGCSGDSDPLTVTTLSDKSFESIIKSGQTPLDLTSYDQRSQEIFSRYNSNTLLVVRYLKPGGSGDGSSFARAAGNLKAVLEGITDATTNNVYVVFLTGGNYTNGDSVSMKNHVAIIGGVDECLGSSETVTALDGENSYSVFFNDGNSLTNTALLYGVTIANGKSDYGGGMENRNSSPSLVGVTFSGNSADSLGGGMYNISSSPSLEGVTFSGNTADQGGGMCNISSSPSLEGVTFSGNTADQGGGMYNSGSSPNLEGVTFSVNTANTGGGIHNQRSSPTLVGVTFSGNAAGDGGGIYNRDSSSSLVGVTFSGNTASGDGGGIYNRGSPSLEGVTFSGNTANRGGGIYNVISFPSLVGVAFSGNTANSGGGMYNAGQSSPTLKRVAFSGNTARFGGGMYNDFSFPTLEGATFSGNTAKNNGGGIYNTNAYPYLVGVTFSGNRATIYGGGIYYDSDRFTDASRPIVNSVFWGNTASTGPQFYIKNNSNNQEALEIYNSIVEGGTGTLMSGTTYTNVNQGGFVAGGGSAPVVIFFSNIINADPQLGPLADNDGPVWTHAISAGSPAVNQGLYVKKQRSTRDSFYYSEDSTAWYNHPALSGAAVPLPADAEDITDATGKARTDRPDLGAYEAR